MAGTLTMRVGQERIVNAIASVAGEGVGVARTVTSSDAAKVAVVPIDLYTYKLRAVAAGTATITLSATGATNDTLAVTVVAATACDKVEIQVGAVVP